jgi:ABC-type Fe3+ transport system permease subunit
VYAFYKVGILRLTVSTYIREKLGKYMRDRQSIKQGKFQLSTRAKIMLFAVFVTVLPTSGFCIASLILSFYNVDSTFSSVNHPTSIPWLTEQSQCQHTHRTWRDNKCWDYEHNPMF